MTAASLSAHTVTLLPRTTSKPSQLASLYLLVFPLIHPMNSANFVEGTIIACPGAKPESEPLYKV